MVIRDMQKSKVGKGIREDRLVWEISIICSRDRQAFSVSPASST